MLISVLPIDKMIITQTFTMARWQIVVKKSEATNQNKHQNNNKNKQKQQQNKRGAQGGGVWVGGGLKSK